MRLRLLALVIGLCFVALTGCATAQRGAAAQARREELAHRLDGYVGQPCKSGFLARWGRPTSTKPLADGQRLVWDRREGDGRAMWRLVFDSEDVLESYTVAPFAEVVTYGQCAW